MRVAFIHDYFTTFAGAERVAKEILLLYPEAEVFTLIHEPQEDLAFLADHKVQTSPLQRLGLLRARYRSLFPLFPWAIERFDVSNFDVIISSSHSVAKGIKTRPGQIHVCYCHSPARWAWDLQAQYLHESGLDKGVKGRVASRLIERFRRWDAKTPDRVTQFIANSHYIRDRIQRVYHRDSTVIYPPVDTDSFTMQEAKQNFYVIVSRLVWYKKIRVAVEAFNGMQDKRLVVVGGGPQLEEILALAGPNIEVRGHVSHEDLRRLMRDAKAMVFPAEEDFGIAPVEAQACGTPVIAYGQGGACETVIDGTTGILFGAQDAAGLMEAVGRFEKIRFDPKAIRKNAERFSTDRFRQEFSDFMTTAIANQA